MLPYLIEAWLIGIAIAAPVGPIGALCIKKTLEIGMIGAMSVGLGAALADGAYGLIAGLGLSAITSFLLERLVLIKVAGGLFLLYLAYREIRSPKENTLAVQSSHKEIFQVIWKVFFLTLANPMTILSFIGVFASIAGGPINTSQSLLLVLGIFLGSMTWWLILGSIILKIKHKLPELWIHRITYLSAIILGGFGIFTITTSLLTLY